MTRHGVTDRLGLTCLGTIPNFRGFHVFSEVFLSKKQICPIGVGVSSWMLVGCWLPSPCFGGTCPVACALAVGACPPSSKETQAKTAVMHGHASKRMDAAISYTKITA